jgi:RimJ/RimL family protein N-acetyltransferase
MTVSGGGENTTRPQQAPRSNPIQAPALSLRAITADDDELLRLLHSPAVSGPWDYFDDSPGDLLPAGSFGGGARIIVDAERGPVGDVSFIQVPYGPNVRSLAWRIGITVLPEHRGLGIGGAAQLMLALELFATSTVNRVEADTDLDNIPEQRALERAGFVREGVVRGAQYRGGQFYDRVLYGLLRSELDGDAVVLPA